MINVKIISNFKKEWCIFGFKKTLLSTFEVRVFWTCKSIFDCVKVWPYKLWNEWKILQIFSWKSKLSCFDYDFSNIQKRSFKKCPLTWVVHLIVFYPIVNLNEGSFENTQELLHETQLFPNVTQKSMKVHNLLSLLHLPIRHTKGK
jgi:hypothetical protein